MKGKRFLLLIGLGLLLTGCARPAPVEPVIKTKIVIAGQDSPPFIKTKIVIGKQGSPDGTPMPRLTGRSPLDPPRAVSLEGESVEVPLFYIHGLPAVELTLNGSGPYRFVIDWGANIFATSPRLADALGLPILGQDEMGNANARVDRLAIGGAEFQDLTLVLDPFFEGSEEAGVLGRNVFEGLLQTLDYPSGLLRLEQGSLPPADGQTVFAYTPTEGGAPMIQAELAGQAFQAVLDTGAARWIILPADQAGRFPFLAGPVSNGIAVGPQLGEAETQAARLDGDLHFGAYTITNPMVEIIDRPEFLFGSGLLKNFAITLDQAGQKVRLKRSSTEPIQVPLAEWEKETPEP
jgi:hypothetical protein